MNEFKIINDYLKKLVVKNKSSLNLNDDVFFDVSKKTVVSVDTYVEGSHFIDFKKPELVMKKIIRSSISDLICKGVVPKYYFIAGTGDRKSFSPSNLKKIVKSLSQEQKKFDICLGGGDTVFSRKLSFTITTIGFSKKIINRSNARVNDDIYVTGNLGDSFIGLNILKKKIKPRDIVTKKALENAATIVAATGGSTNAALHLPAIANEAGINFDLMDVAKIFKKTPYLADLNPGGKYVAKDMWLAGGVPMLLNTLYLRKLTII